MAIGNNSGLIEWLVPAILICNIFGFFYDGFGQLCDEPKNMTVSATYFRTFLYRYPSWYHEPNASLGLHLFACGLLLAGVIEAVCLLPAWYRANELGTGEHEVNAEYKRIGARVGALGVPFFLHRLAELVWLSLEFVIGIADHNLIPTPNEDGYFSSLLSISIHIMYRAFVVRQIYLLLRTVTVGPPKWGTEPSPTAREDLPPSYSIAHLSSAVQSFARRRGMSFEASSGPPPPPPPPAAAESTANGNSVAARATSHHEASEQICQSTSAQSIVDLT
ncbi:hypothetical protein BV898_09511 [Hypsibius exemplaris]|uniref:Uncharacterized protein n=1 Tax=Hypsibius exemplaris TaxID=2072580 RepID=A0A1W0WMC0_HYPEX|nr:hypothetical protein BV898_09511 [Hypsibius exemplaris]